MRVEPHQHDSPYEAQQREWWVQGWLDLLNSYRFKKRLERARNYARQGNVLNIEFRSAKVFARVQGTEAEPYRVTLSLEPFSDEDWDNVVATMGEKAFYAAKLLAGEMPATIETVFAANGLSLFPFALQEIRSKCSCPDKANPCKHVGAVYYVLGDRFSEDPFVLFQLRGRTQDQLVEALRSHQERRLETHAPESGAIASLTCGDRTLAVMPVDPESHPSSGSTATTFNANHFWQYQEPLEPSLVVIAPPPDSDTPLSLLGPIPLPSDGTGSPGDNRMAVNAVSQYLKDAYQAASQQAIATALAR